MSPGELKEIVMESFREWRDDDALQWGAALAFYSALSLAPLLLLLLTAATVAFDEQEVRRQILERLRTWMGPQGASVARTVLEGGRQTGTWAGVTGLAVLLFGATTVFAQLQKALNAMWDVERDEGGFRQLVRSRLLAVPLVASIGVVLLVAVGARAVLSRLPAPAPALELLNVGLSVGIFTLGLAAVYKVLPDVVIDWADVWVGALVTATLLVVGQMAIGAYLGVAAVGSAYGAAGSLVALLVWIYYSALVFFFGAEFTQVWAHRAGRRIEPEEGARRVGAAASGRDAEPRKDEGTPEGEAYP